MVRAARFAGAAGVAGALLRASALGLVVLAVLAVAAALTPRAPDEEARLGLAVLVFAGSGVVFGIRAVRRAPTLRQAAHALDGVHGCPETLLTALDGDTTPAASAPAMQTVAERAGAIAPRIRADSLVDRRALASHAASVLLLAAGAIVLHEFLPARPAPVALLAPRPVSTAARERIAESSAALAAQLDVVLQGAEQFGDSEGRSESPSRAEALLAPLRDAARALASAAESAEPFAAEEALAHTGDLADLVREARDRLDFLEAESRAPAPAPSAASTPSDAAQAGDPTTTAPDAAAPPTAAQLGQALDAAADEVAALRALAASAAGVSSALSGDAGSRATESSGAPSAAGTADALSTAPADTAQLPAALAAALPAASSSASPSAGTMDAAALTSLAAELAALAPEQLAQLLEAAAAAAERGSTSPLAQRPLTPAELSALADATSAALAREQPAPSPESSAAAALSAALARAGAHPFGEGGDSAARESGAFPDASGGTLPAAGAGRGSVPLASPGEGDPLTPVAARDGIRARATALPGAPTAALPVAPAGTPRSESAAPIPGALTPAERAAQLEAVDRDDVPAAYRDAVRRYFDPAL